jgi:hypothetical protein
MGNEDDLTRKRRQSVPTPFYTMDEALLMVAPSSPMRVACVGVAMQLGLRPIVATPETMFQVAASSRPLAIVVEFDPDLDSAKLMDLAVSVGAQVVAVGLTENAQQLVQRIEVAVSAARMLRAKDRL